MKKTPALLEFLKRPGHADGYPALKIKYMKGKDPPELVLLHDAACSVPGSTDKEEVVEEELRINLMSVFVAHESEPFADPKADPNFLQNLDRLHALMRSHGLERRADAGDPPGARPEWFCDHQNDEAVFPRFPVHATFVNERADRQLMSIYLYPNPEWVDSYDIHKYKALIHQADIETGASWTVETTRCAVFVTRQGGNPGLRHAMLEPSQRIVLE